MKTEGQELGYNVFMRNFHNYDDQLQTVAKWMIVPNEDLWIHPVLVYGSYVNVQILHVG